MSSHSPHAGHARSPSAAPWIVVAALIAGALAVGGALVAASWVLLVIGAVLILAGLVFAVVQARRGAVPLAFTREFPANTFGPRGTTDGDSSPPIDTHPNGLPGSSEYRTLEEVRAAEMEEPPDDRRVFPQYSNLSPDERLRNVDGTEVIECVEGEADARDSRRRSDDGER